jgi:hypothetical protein
MIDLDLGSQRRARVWLSELPADALVDSVETIASDPITERPLRTNLITGCAVEILHPSSPRWHYGLLGATFVPDGSTVFHGVVPMQTPRREDLPWTLAASVGDQLAVGLSRREAQAVASVFGFPGSEIVELLPSGTLRVSHAVMAMAGSSPAMFQSLAHCLVGMISEEAQALTDARLVEILRSGLRYAFSERR